MYACPKKIYDQIIKVHQYNSSCATSISQWGALEGLKSCMNDVENMKESFKERMNFTYKRLKSMGLEVVKPKGAFYIYPNISKFGLHQKNFVIDYLKKAKLPVYQEMPLEMVEKDILEYLIVKMNLKEP